MRHFLLAAAVALGPSGSVAAQERVRPAAAAAASATQIVYFGTRASGSGNGIVAARFDPRTGKLSSLGVQAEVERPTWLLPSRDRATLYAVSEVGNDGKSQASVYSFAADVRTGKLDPTGKVPSGGGGATHLYLGGRPSTLLVANFGTGDVASLPLTPDGRVLPPGSVRREVGSGPHPRQKSAHPHAIAIAPGGRHALVADLGADAVFVYPFDPSSSTLGANPTAVAAKPGSGPRHIAFRPNGRFVYVNSELTAEITIYAWDLRAGRLTPIRTVSTLSPTWSGEKSAGEIALSRDGRFLYLSNRGEDTIVTYAVDARTGALKEVQRIASGGKQPWSFASDPSERWLIVANEGSDLAAVFRREPVSGKLFATGETLGLPHPSSVAFVGAAGR